MRTLFAILAFSVLAAAGIGAQGAGAAAIELEGRPLAEVEMEEVTGGLPRCCDDLDYDPIEDKCLNNKGQPYEANGNDCDIWVENVLKQACIDISGIWGAASRTTVGGHEAILVDRLVSIAPAGWSIEIIDGSHVALIRVNTDGSADIFHQGHNRATDTMEAWDGSRGYHYESARSAYWGDTAPRFWGID